MGCRKRYVPSGGAGSPRRRSQLYISRRLPQMLITVRRFALVALFLVASSCASSAQPVVPGASTASTSSDAETPSPDDETAYLDWSQLGSREDVKSVTDSDARRLILKSSSGECLLRRMADATQFVGECEIGDHPPTGVVVVEGTTASLPMPSSRGRGAIHFFPERRHVPSLGSRRSRLEAERDRCFKEAISEDESIVNCRKSWKISKPLSWQEFTVGADGLTAELRTLVRGHRARVSWRPSGFTTVSIDPAGGYVFLQMTDAIAFGRWNGVRWAESAKHNVGSEIYRRLEWP